MHYSFTILGIQLVIDIQLFFISVLHQQPHGQLQIEPKNNQIINNLHYYNES